MGIGACIFGCSGTGLTDAESGFFREVRPAGFILFDRNEGDVEDIRRLVGQLREAAGHDAPVLTDHEGGRVQRFTGDEWRQWLPALDQCNGVAPEQRERSMWLRYRIIAGELIRTGINGNCVPLADIADGDTHPVLRNRCYGEDPDSVIRAARAVARGCIDGGVIPVLKHMPGHGGTGLDSHVELPVNSRSLATLEASEFRAFRELNDLPLGMTAHVVYRALDPDLPATVSPTVIGHIRTEIGFDGLLMSDDISMSALGGSLAERAEAARGAGCDAILHCNGKLSEMESVAAKSGCLDRHSCRRLERAVASVGKPEPAGIADLENEFAAILEQISC